MQRRVSNKLVRTLTSTQHLFHTYILLKRTSITHSHITIHTIQSENFQKWSVLVHTLIKK